MEKDSLYKSLVCCVLNIYNLSKKNFFSSEYQMQMCIRTQFIASQTFPVL